MDTFKPLAHSSQPLTNSSRTLTQGSQSTAEKAAFSTERARLLLGQFQRGKADDPATFTAGVAAILSRYSCEVVCRATDPRIGLALKYDWLPTLRQVYEECEIHAERERIAERRRTELRQQLQRREAEREPPSEEERRRVAARLEEFNLAMGRRTAAQRRAEAEETLARYLAEANAGPSAARSESWLVSPELAAMLDPHRSEAE